jgi:STE24 endopeptidase
LAVLEANLFLSFALFAALFHQQAVYSAFGFASEQPVLVGLIIVLQYVAAPYNAVLDFAVTWLDRRQEFAADAFAAGLGRGGDLTVVLAGPGHSFPVADWLYSAFRCKHPPLIERMAAISEAQNKDN